MGSHFVPPDRVTSPRALTTILTPTPTLTLTPSLTPTLARAHISRHLLESELILGELLELGGVGLVRDWVGVGAGSGVAVGVGIRAWDEVQAGIEARLR